MRIVILITVLLLAAGLASGVSFEKIGSAGGPIHDWMRTALNPAPDDTNTALATRCGELESWRRRTCEESLAARFSSGKVDPQAVLRLHCTRVASVWDVPLPEPPALCANRFGGWLSG